MLFGYFVLSGCLLIPTACDGLSHDLFDYLHGDALTSPRMIVQKLFWEYSRKHNKFHSHGLPEMNLGRKWVILAVFVTYFENSHARRFISI